MVLLSFVCYCYVSAGGLPQPWDAGIQSKTWREKLHVRIFNLSRLGLCSAQIRADVALYCRLN